MAHRYSQTIIVTYNVTDIVRNFDRFAFNPRNRLPQSGLGHFPRTFPPDFSPRRKM